MIFSLNGMRKIVVTVAAVGSLILAFSCTKHPNEEQIRQMEETRSAALSAEQKLEEVRQQRQDLEDQLAQKEQERDKVCADRDAVKERLENWGE